MWQDRYHPSHSYPLLLAWALSAFHTSVFVAVALLGLHLGGALGPALAQLDTLTGMALFLGLWGTGWWATRFGARGIGAAVLGRWMSDGALVNRGPMAGGLNGALFYAWLALVLALRSLVGGQPEVAALFVSSAVVGVPFAFIFGVAFGFVFAVLDTVLIEVGRAQVIAGLPPPATGVATPTATADVTPEEP
ncbi:MAG: hypothetical protein U0531_21020 [Dehalococcoidia bacterium]